MSKTPITELPIDVYTPVEIGLPYIAFIRGLPIMFKESSPVKVKKAAEDWRTEEVAKIEKREAAKLQRLEKMKEARELKKASQ